MKTKIASVTLPLDFDRGLAAASGDVLSVPRIEAVPRIEHSAAPALETHPTKLYVLTSVDLPRVLFWEDLVFWILGGSGIVTLACSFFA